MLPESDKDSRRGSSLSNLQLLYGRHSRKQLVRTIRRCQSRPSDTEGSLRSQRRLRSAPLLGESRRSCRNELLKSRPASTSEPNRNRESCCCTTTCRSDSTDTQPTAALPCRVPAT